MKQLLMLLSLTMVMMGSIHAEEIAPAAYFNPANYASIQEANKQFEEVFGPAGEPLKEVELIEGQKLYSALFTLDKDIYISLQAFEAEDDRVQPIIYYGFLAEDKEALLAELNHIYPEQGEAIMKASVEEPYVWEDLLFIFEEIDSDGETTYFVNVYNKKQYQTFLTKLSNESR